MHAETAATITTSIITRFNKGTSQVEGIIKLAVPPGAMLCCGRKITMPSRKALKKISRRGFLQSTSLAAAGLAGSWHWLPSLTTATHGAAPLAQFNYGDVTLASDLHEKQFRQTQTVLMNLS